MVGLPQTVVGSARQDSSCDGRSEAHVRPGSHWMSPTTSARLRPDGPAHASVTPLSTARATPSSTTGAAIADGAGAVYDPVESDGPRVSATRHG